MNCTIYAFSVALHVYIMLKICTKKIRCMKHVPIGVEVSRNVGIPVFSLVLPLH